jgi:hypothetical protein
MERAVNMPGARGMANRARCRGARNRRWMGATTVIVLAAIAAGSAGTELVITKVVAAPAPAPSSDEQSLSGPRKPRTTEPVALRLPIGARAGSRADSDSTPPARPAPISVAGSIAVARSSMPRRFKVRDEFGHCVVARLHGQNGDESALILPDGQLGMTKRLIPTNEPFQPLTADQLQSVLLAGPYADYLLLKTDHYLIFYKSTLAFAQDSGRLLEDLYRGLIDTFRRKQFPVHESEFPLVAVIFATESDFRAHKQVDAQVQAYYEFFTNRIFFYQKSERDQMEPKVAALLKPQTVAHEGAHQILCNIGVQPRLAAWPLWLIEGLAEYCATTVSSKKGITWNGMGRINSLHMATIRELEDPLSNQVQGAVAPAVPDARQLSIAQSESLMLKSALTPTDYAQAWALTHYLAQNRGTEIVNFLKAMSQITPLAPRSTEANLGEFRKFFGGDLARLDRKVDEHVHKISQKKTYDTLFCYAVLFRQTLGNGMVSCKAYVSQSPQMIQQWVQEVTDPSGYEPSWEFIPRPTRAQAIFTAEEWMRSNRWPPG